MTTSHMIREKPCSQGAQKWTSGHGGGDPTLFNIWRIVEVSLILRSAKKGRQRRDIYSISLVLLVLRRKRTKTEQTTTNDLPISANPLEWKLGDVHWQRQLYMDYRLYTFWMLPLKSATTNWGNWTMRVQIYPRASWWRFKSKNPCGEIMRIVAFRHFVARMARELLKMT